MRKGDKKIFGDKQKLYRLVNLRRCGYSLVFLGKIFGCDHKTVYSQLEKYAIPSPEEEYTLGNIILYALKPQLLPSYHERRLIRTSSGLENMGQASYQDYLREANIPKGQPFKYVIV